MNKFLIALCIGTVAGIIDITPMIFRKLDKYSCLSAFIHWVALGMIIPFVNWEIQPWLKGLIIAEVTAIPIMLIIFPKEPEATIPIVIFSAILGISVGYAGAKFIG